MSSEIWVLSVTGFLSFGSSPTISELCLIPSEVLDAFTRLPFSQREEIVKSSLQSAMDTLRQQIAASTCPSSPSPSSGTSSECSSMSTLDSLTPHAEVVARFAQLNPLTVPIPSALNSILNLLTEHERRLSKIEQRLLSRASDD